jgi:hypothetical protein
MSDYPQLSAVIADNVRRLRTDTPPGALSQDGLARNIRYRGIQWTRATVAAIETGRRSVSLVEGVALADVLGVGLGDLVSTTSSHVKVDLGIWSSDYLAGAVTGDTDGIEDAFQSDELRHLSRVASQGIKDTLGRFSLLRSRWGRDVSMKPAAVVERESRIGDVEATVASRLESRTRLGVTGLEVVVAADAMWRRSFTEERERRVAAQRPAAVLSPRTRQALRGRATRDMEREMQKAIEDRASEAATLSSVAPVSSPTTRRARGPAARGRGSTPAR